MSTIKVDTIESKTINGDITVSSPLVGDGSGLTGVTVSKAAVEALGIDVPAANLTGSIANARIPESAVTQHVTATEIGRASCRERV